MTYVMSDLHGRRDLYLKMLEKIKLTNSDTLYILGDFVDRGDEGLRILLDVAERDNVIGIMGNHDYLALCILMNLDKPLQGKEEATLKSLIDGWLAEGGHSTYREFKGLSPKEQKLALMTLDSLRNYAEVRVGDKEFVLCHGGISGYERGSSLCDYTTEDFIFIREDLSRRKFNKKGKFLVTGHTPTAAIEGARDGKIYKNLDHIAIDCGAVFGLGLGCLCLDTMEEFYVS